LPGAIGQKANAIPRVISIEITRICGSNIGEEGYSIKVNSLLNDITMSKDHSIQQNKTIIVKEKGKTHQVEMEKIMYISCDGYLSTLHLHKNSEGNISVSKLLKNFEHELADYGFSRVNRCTLVNLKHVKYYDCKRKPFLSLVNDEQITVSCRQRSRIKQIMDN